MKSGVLAYPMHGQHKLSNEGYRTRDGHIIEWLGKFAYTVGDHVTVVSRPEPLILAPTRRIRGAIAQGTCPVQTLTWRVPHPDPKRWWIRSAAAYPSISARSELPAVVWNPFAATAPDGRNPFTRDRTVVFDLLDDWTVHRGFASISREVSVAYAKAFEKCHAVFANSEGTLALAHRYGRSDATLLTNGVDPDRFGLPPSVTGPLTIGYVGKIGHRLDSDLISSVTDAFRDVRFVFAGPILDEQEKYRQLFSSRSNVTVLGDVHYNDVPALMSTFDLGWVPHAVGEGEVGGDVIKTYEYRATGLQVLTTPILGAGRTLTEGVHVVPAKEQVSWLRDAIKGRQRLDRIAADIPADLTWRHKAGCIAQALGTGYIS